MEMEENTAVEAAFFDGRLKLLNSKCLDLQKDVLVVPCYPDILNGGEFYREIMSKVGDSVRESLNPFVIYDPGTCKITFSGELKDFKRLALCVLPDVDEEGLSFIDRLKVAMAINDALDLSVEMAAESIVFSHWNVSTVELAAEILILCIAKWLRTSCYREKVKEIIIAIDDEHVFDIYYNLTGLIVNDPTLILDVLQDHPEDEYIDQDDRNVIDYPIDLTEVNQSIAEHSVNQVQVTRDKKIAPPFLFYSRNLSTSILSIEQPNGNLRQYRLSTTIMEKNTHYFRCSRCDYFNKTRNDIGIYRPKITIKDGDIASDRFPSHHPLCEEVPKLVFVLQQLDRMWKSLVPIETEELRHAYHTLRQIAQQEADSLYKEMDTPKGRYPEWEVLKNESMKMHNQFSLRLIKSATDANVSGITPETYSAIREVEGELDGNQGRNVAWLTTEESPPDQQTPNIVKTEPEDPDQPSTSGAGILKRRSSYRIRNVNETGPQYKFRIVRPRAEETSSPTQTLTSSFQSPSKRSRL